MIACRSRTSAAARTNESATKSTPRPSANSRSLEILLRQRRDRHRDAGQVDALVGLDLAADDDPAACAALVDLLDRQAHEAVVDQDVVPRRGAPRRSPPARSAALRSAHAARRRRRSLRPSAARAARRGRRFGASAPADRRSAQAACRSPPAPRARSLRSSRDPPALPCERLRRIASTPASTSSRRTLVARRHRADRRDDLRPAALSCHLVAA